MTDERAAIDARRVEPSGDRSTEAFVCRPEDGGHHWVSYSQAAVSALDWVVKCSQCETWNWEDHNRQIEARIDLRALALMKPREDWVTGKVSFEYFDGWNDALDASSRPAAAASSEPVL